MDANDVKDISEKVLGTMKVERLASTAGMLTPSEKFRGGRRIQEKLYLTPDRVIVANITGRLRMTIATPYLIFLSCTFWLISFLIIAGLEVESRAHLLKDSMFDEPHHSFSDHLKKTLETERRYFTDEEDARGVLEE